MARTCPITSKTLESLRGSFNRFLREEGKATDLDEMVAHSRRSVRYDGRAAITVSR
jgi:hypothetical protein